MADATIGALRVVLGADIGTFEDGLKTAQGALGSFAKKITEIAGGIKLEKIIDKSIKLAVDAVTEGFHRIDAVGKEAQKVGIGVEAFSGLILSAELADVSMETLATSLGRLSKNMAETAAGTGEAEKTFRALGISVTNTDGTLKTSDQVLTEIAGKFETTSDGAAKTAAAIALLGRGGKELIPLLNEGAASLKEMTETAQRMGLIIDQNTANAVQKFNDNLKILGKTQEGITNIVIAALIPALVRLSDQFAQTAKDGTLQQVVAERIINTFKQLAVTAAQAALVAGDSVQTWKLLFQIMNSGVLDTEGVAEKWNRLTELFRTFPDRMAAVRGEMLKLCTALTVNKKATDDMETSINKVQETINNLKLRTAELTQTTTGLADGFRQQAVQLKLMTAEQAIAINSAEQLKGKSKELNNEMLLFQGAKIAEQSKTAWERYNETMGKVQDALKATEITAETQSKLMQKQATDTAAIWLKSADDVASNFGQALSLMAKQNKDFALAAKAIAISIDRKSVV